MRPLLANLATLFRDNVATASIKKVLIGQEDQPRVQDLPQIQVIPDNTIVELSGTAKDIQRRSVTIRVIESTKRHIGQNTTSYSTISSMLAVADFMEAKKSNGAFATSSIMGVLRHNPTIAGQALFVDDMEVDYTTLGDLGFPNSMATVSCIFTARDLTK